MGMNRVGGRRERLRRWVNDRLPGEKPGTVGVVRVQGVIAPSASLPVGAVVNERTMERRLRSAFGLPDLRAVALVINSPGGAPTQAELIARRVRALADEHEVPVLAFCEDVVASGGYWIACAADEIYVASTSLVGSIGVVSSGFGFDRALERLGVERRLYATGAAKARLDPFRPEDPADVEWLRHVQERTFAEFRAWVRERRGEKLRGTADELFTGDVWVGADAVERGLVDGVGVVREVLERRFPRARRLGSEPPRSLAARLGLVSGGWGAAVVDGALGAVAARSLWGAHGR